MNQISQISQMLKYFYFVFVLSIPGIIEQCLYISNCKGNMAIYGVFLGIFYKRNALYFSLVLTVLSYLFGYKFILIFGIFLSGLFGFKMCEDIYNYRFILLAELQEI